jgi:AAA15 family ATPase/GTPase
MIDELHNQLHPLLQKYIVDLFYNSNTVAQLIYTTHDTTLLDKQYVRRDQIWFTNKNEYGESTLYSLADYKIRNDKSFTKDYLSGAFDAIPRLRKFSHWEDSNGD